MNALSNFLYKKSSLWLSITFTILSFSYLFIVMVGKSKNFEVHNGEIFLGTSFGFSQEMVLQFLSNRNKDMLIAYKTFLTVWDVIYPVIYGLQYIFWISYLFKPFASRTKWLNLVGVVPCVLDWLENFQLVVLTNQYLDSGTIKASDVQLASVFSILKWITTALIFALIVYGVYLQLKNYMVNKKQNS